MSQKHFDCCPHCGGTSGLYTKTTFVNVPYCFGYNGELQYNGEMFENAEELKNGNLCYCQDCDKAVCRTSSLEFYP